MLTGLPTARDGTWPDRLQVSDGNMTVRGRADGAVGG